MAAHSEGQQRQQRRQLARAARCVPMLQAMTILSSPHLMLAMTPRQAELSGPLRSCRAARVGRVRGPPGQRLVAHQVPGWSDGLHHNAGVCVWRGWGVGVGWGALVDVWVGWARKLCCQPRAAPVGPQLQLCCHILLCCASPATPALPTISRLARGVLEVLLRCQTLCAAASVCNIVSPFHCTHPSTRPAQKLPYASEMACCDGSTCCADGMAMGIALSKACLSDESWRAPPDAAAVMGSRFADRVPIPNQAVRKQLQQFAAPQRRSTVEPRGLATATLQQLCSGLRELALDCVAELCTPADAAAELLLPQPHLREFLYALGTTA